jgi:hypothetical protein
MNSQDGILHSRREKGHFVWPSIDRRVRDSCLFLSWVAMPVPCFSRRPPCETAALGMTLIQTHWEFYPLGSTDWEVEGSRSCFLLKICGSGKWPSGSVDQWCCIGSETEETMSRTMGSTDPAVPLPPVLTQIRATLWPCPHSAVKEHTSAEIHSKEHAACKSSERFFVWCTPSSSLVYFKVQSSSKDLTASARNHFQWSLEGSIIEIIKSLIA